ncbi:cellulase family glycosylhydrolase [Oxalobacteraceae bacterium A2-2]
MKWKTLAAALLAAAAFAQPAVAGPLSISNGKFMKDGKPFYGVGVNYFDAFYRYGVYNQKTGIAGLATLKQYNVPFVRIAAIAFWPNEIQGSFINNQAVFLNRLDEFMNAAQAQGIGVVLDVFWNWTAFADLKGEHIPEWGNSASQTRAYMREITTLLATRYKDHPALWAWEFGNEATSLMDIPPSVGNYQWLPSAPTQGAPARTTADNITPSTIISALTDFATTLRAVDPNTPIFSGNDVPYYSAYHLQQSNGNNWSSDTPAQFGLILARNNPAPIDTFTIHLYPKAEGEAGKYFSQPSTATYDDIVAAAKAQSVLSGKPLFLGEFGVDQSLYSDVPQRFETIMNSIVNNRVQMSALWVYDLSTQNTTYNVTSSNARAYQLQKVQTVNLDMATWQ